MSHPLILEQTIGPNPLRATLQGSSLPEKELRERLSLAHVKEYYPGNSEPNVQVLSVQARPISISGLLSDRETQILGFADATRAALRQMFLDARPIRLLYRTVLLEGLIINLEFSERDEFECGYEIEFDPHVPGGAFPRRPLPEEDTLLHAGTIAARQAEWQAAYEQLPPDVLIPPASVGEYYYEDLPVIPPVAFELDPWLRVRLVAEEIQRATRFLLELIGDESALNANDRIYSAAKAAWLAANTARTLLDAWTGEGFSLSDQIIYAGSITAAIAAIDNLREALG